MKSAIPSGWMATTGRLALMGSLLFCSACASVGPSRKGVVQSATSSTTLQGIRIVDVNEAVAMRLQAAAVHGNFADLLGDAERRGATIGSGDVLEITIWEAPPAVLFGATMPSSSSSSVETSRSTSLPPFVVGPTGQISVPFAGMVQVAGRTLREVEQTIIGRLRGQAHLPQVMVRMTTNAAANVTVVGDVDKSTRMPLTPKGETLLDALAAAGGTRQPIGKMTVQVSRGASVVSMPLQSVIADPRQNVVLRSGDVVTAIYQPYSFTVLGATGKNDEIDFEGTGLTLAQAMGRIGGLQDGRADAKGLFLFRWEDPAVAPAGDNSLARADGRVPVVYKVDMKDPATYFLMQRFAVRDKDVLYVSNSPIMEFQRFLGVVATAFIPISTVDNALNRN
ncbi:MAG: polysaccharide biosynthesis/export family protein [Sphingobium sp.]